MSDMESQPRSAKKFEFTPEGTVRNNPHEPSTARPSPNRRSSSRPSRTVVVLIIAVVLLFVALVIVSVFLGIADRRKSPATASTAALSDKDVCMTEECAEAAVRSNSYINDRTLPCDDFYQFACGGWLEHNVIPAYSTRLSALTSFWNQRRIAIKNLLEDERNEQESRSFKQSKILYKSCMSGKVLTQTFEAFLKSAFNDWPLLREAGTETNFNLTKTLSNLTIVNNIHLFSIRVNIDQQNTSRRVLELSEPNVDIWPTEDRNTKKKFIADIAKLFAESNNELGLANDIDNLLDFWRKIQTLVNDSRNAQSNETNKALTIPEIQNLHSIKGFEWNQYFDTLMTSAGLPKLDNNERIIIIKSPLYFKKLGELFEATDKSFFRTAANFLTGLFVFLNNKMLGAENLVLELIKDTLPISGTNARYVYCVDKTVTALRISVVQMYLKNTFNLDSKKAVNNLTRDIQRSVTELLNHIDWMNPNLKQALREKSEKMSIVQPEIMSTSDVDKHYSNYHFDEHSFFNNTIFAEKENFKRKLSLLRAVEDKEQLRGYSTDAFDDVNYSALRNQLTVGFVGSQPPFFSNNYPRYLSYAALGSKIAKELMNSFGINGAYVSKQNTWDMIRQQANPSIYDSKGSCFQNQIRKLKDSDDGKKDINVDFLAAEVGGIKVAFMAYKKWQAEHGKLEQLLPAVKFDQDQLFFLSFAQLHCGKSKQNGTEMHTELSYKRVMTALKNSPEFAKAFHCSANSAMNPGEKCAIW